MSVIGSIVILVWLLGIIAIAGCLLFLVYWVIKKAVKNGMIEAHREIDNRSREENEI